MTELKPGMRVRVKTNDYLMVAKDSFGEISGINGGHASVLFPMSIRIEIADLEPVEGGEPGVLSSFLWPEDKDN